MFIAVSYVSLTETEMTFFWQLIETHSPTIKNNLA